LDQIDIDNAAAAADPTTAITNSASGTGTPAGGLPLNATSSSSTTGFTPAPSLSMQKTAGAPTPGFQIGGQVSYSYLVRNTGNVTVTDTISISDNRIDAAGGSYNCTPIATTDLAPNATMTCTAIYDITENDLLIGSVSNNATASARSVTSPIGSQTVPTGTPALSITKTTMPSPATYTKAGDTVTYSYTAQNTGAVAFVRPVTVSDDKINGGAPFT